MTVAHDNWHIVETEFDPQVRHHKETAFTSTLRPSILKILFPF
jgi:hypothetical protein